MPAEGASSDDPNLVDLDAIDLGAAMAKAPRPWMGLAMFWGAVAMMLAAGAVTLEVMGTPVTSPRRHAEAQVRRPAATPVLAAVPAHPPMIAPSPMPPGRLGAGSIAAPDATLLDLPKGSPPPEIGSSNALPIIAPDGRASMQVYAASFDRTIKTPRIGLVLAGIGLDAAASEDAIRTLPAAVTLAVSPYAVDLNPILAVARGTGHEFLLSIPMEPQGYPQNDPGVRALLTSATPQDNAVRLDWALSRIAGYVGVTGALGEMRGERFAAVADQMNPVLAILARRGLLYVDARPGMARLPDVWSCDVEVVIDDAPSADAIDVRLAELERHAHDSGEAVGLVGAVRPVTIARLRAWVGNLAARGFVLAPVSALVTAPANAAAGKAAD